MHNVVADILSPSGKDDKSISINPINCCFNN